MSKESLQRSENIYSFILKFYPKSYQEHFGEEMKFVFSESLKDANTEKGGVVDFWIRTIIDSGKSIIKENLENRKGGEKMKNKNIARPLVATLAILSVPFLAMLISIDGFAWSLFDFMLMGTLIFGTGLAVEVANMKIKNKNHMIVAVAAIVLALLVVWVHLAVGIVDTWPLVGS